MNLLMKGAALAPPFSCTTKYSSDVYSPRPPDIRVRLLPTKPPVHFTTEQPGRDNKELDREIHSKENGVDYDFAVSLYSSLVAQKDLFGSPAPEVIIDAAMRCGFMMGRAYDVTIPEDIPKPTPPRRSRRPSRKTAPKPTAQKDGTDNEK